MSCYEPFLLSLLNTESKATRLIKDPLEEEHFLRTQHGPATLDWNAIAAKVKETYGLPMMLHVPKEAKILKRIDGDNRMDVSTRSLILRIGTVDVFIMEHPSGLTLFDLHGESSQRPALLKPSLFARWWLKEPERACRSSRAVDTTKDSQIALHRLLAEIVEEGHPSDWHLEPRPEGYQTRARLDGHLGKPIPWTREKAEWVINSICQGCQASGWNDREPLDASMRLSASGKESIPVRISIVPTLHGPALVIRFLYPSNLDSIEGLGFPEEDAKFIRHAFQCKEGLWIIAGPTGTGKTTTLHAFVRMGVEEHEKILAIEDPVERLIPGVDQLSLNKPQGLTYPLAMRAFLRQSPDTILIGEIRDNETAALVIQAARTGHRVLSTLHARTPRGVEKRFMDLDQNPDAVGSVLHVLVLQQLVRLLCTSCKIYMKTPRGAAIALRKHNLPVSEMVYKAGGCPSCQGGYSGRRAVVCCSHWPFSQPEDHVFSKGGASMLQKGIIDIPTLMPLIGPRLRASFALCQP